MLSRVISVFFFLFFALPLLAAATAIPRDGDCNTGPIQCCNQVQSATPQALGLFQASLASFWGPSLGLSDLQPIERGGHWRQLCSAQPVCCTNNTFSGLIALGCMPININL
ncbi:fungal hydrophobin-domain-containing protein [Infundibulicybe gibba]|nr:fungal hydrophobin-domain-containing protein [Infundibulicybe gibba]